MVPLCRREPGVQIYLGSAAAAVEIVQQPLSGRGGSYAELGLQEDLPPGLAAPHPHRGPRASAELAHLPPVPCFVCVTHTLTDLAESLVCDGGGDYEALRQRGRNLPALVRPGHPDMFSAILFGILGYLTWCWGTRTPA